MTVGRLLLAAGGCSVLLVGTAQAATPMASGYWWVAESGQVAVPAPATVPANGLYVASTASGATAVSAVRFTLPEGRADARLVLKVHQLEQGDTLSVDACTTKSAWLPGSAQPWSSRPTCAPGAAPVHGALSSDSATLTFTLSSLLPGESASLLLLPGNAVPAAAGAPAAPSPTFDISFEPLVASSVVSTQVQEPVAAGPAATFDPSSGGDVPNTSQPALSAAAPPALLGPLVPSAPAQVAAPAAVPSVDPLLPGSTQQVPAAATAAVHASERSGRDKALLVFLLAAATFYLGWLARSQTATSTRTSIYDLPPVEQDP